MINYAARIDDEELLTICENIPIKEYKECFAAHSETYNAIKGGFNYRKAAPESIYAFVIRNKSFTFISRFLSQHIEHILHTIDVEIKKQKAGGADEGEALIVALTQSVFCNNKQTYFKLKKIPVSHEFIIILDYAGILFLKNRVLSLTMEMEQLNKAQENNTLEEQLNKIEQLQQSLADAQALHARET